MYGIAFPAFCCNAQKLLTLSATKIIKNFYNLIASTIFISKEDSIFTIILIFCYNNESYRIVTFQTK